MARTLKDAILSEIVPDEVIAFAKDLVNIPSYTTDETEVARFIHAFFQRQGLESELQEVDPERVQTIGRLRGTSGGRSLMLNGHIDIDPIPTGWVRDPWTPTIEGDRFYGAGIYNMKGGVAAMVMGAIAARRAGRLAGDVVVACVDGELQGGVGTVHMLRAGVRADMAIVPEPYSTALPGQLRSLIAPLLAVMLPLNGQLAYSDQAIEDLAVPWLLGKCGTSEYRPSTYPVDSAWADMLRLPCRERRPLPRPDFADTLAEFQVRFPCAVPRSCGHPGR